MKKLESNEAIESLVDFICLIGSDRIGQMIGSHVAEFIVLLGMEHLYERERVKISDVLIKLSPDEVHFTTEVYKQIKQDQTARKLFRSALCDSQVNGRLIIYSPIIAGILLNISDIHSYISKDNNSMTGSTKVSVKDLVESALSLSPDTVSDLCDILSSPVQEIEVRSNSDIGEFIGYLIKHRLKAVAAVLVAQLQFKALLNDPELRMSPLPEVNLEDEYVVINFAEQLGLKYKMAPRSISGNKICLYNKWKELPKLLKDSREGPPRNSALVQGSPGLGKSCAVMVWCQHEAAEKSIVWISFQNKAKKFVVIMREGYIFYSNTEIMVVKDEFIHTYNFCKITVIDGISKHLGKETMEAADLWTKPTNLQIDRHLIAVSSLQYIDKEAIKLDIPRWYLEDYLDIVGNDDFWNDVKSIFTTCALCQEKFGDLLNHEIIPPVLRGEIIEYKYKFAGISSRFMFDKNIQAIINTVKYSFSSLSSDKPEPQASELASNTLYYEIEDCKKFSSDYIAELYEEKKMAPTESLETLWKRAVPGTKGQVFEFFLLRLSRLNRSYQVTTLLDSDKNPEETPITIQSTGYTKFLDLEPPWESLKPNVKHKALNCESEVRFYSPRDFSNNYLGAANPSGKWSGVKNDREPNGVIQENINTEEVSITPEKNIEFHNKMGKLYQGVKSRFVRYFDTKNKSHYWLVPEKSNEPAFDAIYVLNNSQEGSTDSQTDSKQAEVWLIQFTVAAKHTVNESGLKRAKKVLQEVMGSNVIIRFVFIVPTGQKSLTIVEKENLLRHSIPYRICELLQANP
jgi:hypothetical protein